VQVAALLASVATAILALAVFSNTAGAAEPPSSSLVVSARQDVAVAFIEPKTEIDLDVTTGAVSVGGSTRNGSRYDGSPLDPV
jgi:hypothetical protein